MSKLGYTVHDNQARVAITYNADDVEVARRLYTPEENAAADAANAAEVVEGNKSSLQTNLEADLVWLQEKIGLTNNALNAEFNNNPAQFLKPLMRVMRRSVKQSLGDYSTPD